MKNKSTDKKRFKDIYHALLGVILLVAIILAPVVYFSLDDVNKNGWREKISDIEFSLDDKAEDIYMVRRIHKLIGSYYLLDSSENGDPEGIFISDGDTETHTEISYETTDQDSFEKWLIGALETAGKEGKKYKEKGVYQIVTFDEDRSISMRFDGKSAKVFEASGRWEKSISKQEIETALRRVLNYEELLVVGDWYYSDKKMVSRNASLALYFDRDEDQWHIYFQAI